MFRPPKSSNQSPKKGPSTFHKHQGLCKYPHRSCVLPTLESYDFCLKHILEDKNAPYKPCPYLYTVSGKKCGKAAYRPDRRDTWFCAEHSRKSNLLRQKASSRHAPPPTTESLLASLAHYSQTQDKAVPKKEEDETASNVTAKAVNPFVDLDASKVNGRCSQVLDFTSDSESDVEPAMLDSVWRAQDHESSDAESVDSQAEDPLKYAGVYTAEEVTVVIKDKMIRLQSLYIDQFRRLQHLLKERRRKYLHTLKKEKETLCSIHNQDKSTVKEQHLYKKLKALNHYHKYYGEEAILHKKALEKRTQATENHLVRTSHKGKCIFTEGGVKCGAKTLPAIKYCRKHILEDTQQVLFRACGFKRDDLVCQEPTLNVFENATCVYHITLPAQPHNCLDTAHEVKEVKLEKENMKHDHEDEVIAKTLLDLEASGIRVDDSLIKPNEPDITEFEPTESANSETTKQELSKSEEQTTVSDKSPEPLPVASIVSQQSEHQPLSEPNEPTVTDKPQTDKPTTSEEVEAKTLVVTEVAENLPKEASSELNIGTNEVVEENSQKEASSDLNINTNEVVPESSQKEASSDLNINTNEVVVEKMDVDSEVVTSTVDNPKNESVEDFVMVEMMSDVDVVEEVLESEDRTESVESMQPCPKNDADGGKG